MIRNYLKTALRNIKRHKGYTIINFVGLLLGLISCLVIFLYIRYEMSYDRYHEFADDIYRINSEVPIQGQGSYINATSPGLLAPALLEDVPEVVVAARIRVQETVISLGERCFQENRFFIADPEILDIFTFPLLVGDAATALDMPYTLLITEEMAQKYFGTENPLGKILRVNGDDFTITGVLKNIPKNSHFTFDFLASMNTVNRDMFQWRSTNYLRTYVRLRNNVDLKSVEAKMAALLEKHMENPFWIFHLQPLTGIHLKGNINHEWEVNSHISYIYIFTAVACIILLIACFNYINLSTASAAARLKEIGIRKVIGANQHQLIRQFLGETLMMTFFALIIAVVCVMITLPWFNILIHRQLEFRPWQEMNTLAILTICTLIVGIFSGIYPALYLAKTQPVDSLYGRKTLTSATALRRALVVIQFFFSIVLIFSTFVVHRQLSFVKHGDLGFVQENILHIDISNPDLQRSYEPLINLLGQHPDITGMTFSSHLPNNVNSHTGAIRWEGLMDEDRSSFFEAFIDESFLDIYEIQILQGRNFSQNIQSDMEQAYIINETAAKVIGWENPIGKRFGYGMNGTVIGMVEDFHNQSFHQPIQPVVFMPLGPNRSHRRDLLSIRIKSENISNTLSFIRDNLEAFGQPFEYTFFDDDIAMMYSAERQMELVCIAFACLSIIIASLGLFGLAIHTTEQRKKEIGIRKVAGASAIRIAAILSQGFLKSVCIASLFAWPIAYYFMNKWLQNFTYHINLSVWYFILSGLVALAIVLLTVSYHTIKAARANPADSLRCE